MRKHAVRSLAWGCSALGLATTFAGALVVGLSAHSNLPAFRRLAQNVTNDLLGNVFAGRLVIGKIDRLVIGRRGHVIVSHVEILDPDGKRVIDAKDVDGEIDLAALLASLVKGGVKIDLDIATIGDADVTLDVNEQGTLGIVRAFASKKPSQEPPPPTKEGGSLYLRIANTKIGHARAHGNLVPPELDGDVAKVRADLKIENDVFLLDLHEAKTTLRSPRAPEQAAPLEGDAKGTLRIPFSHGKISAHAELVGHVGEVPVVANASIADDELDASIDIAKTEAAAVTRAFPIVPITKPVEIHATAKGKLPAIGIEARARLGDADATVKGSLVAHDDVPFHVDVDASRVDASALGSIETDVSGHVHAEGHLATKDGPRGTFRVVTKAGSVVREPIPPATIEGTFDRKRVVGGVQASEPGVDATGKIDLDVPAKTLDFDVRARSNRLNAVRHSGGAVSGSATARAQGRIDLEAGTIRGNVTADGNGVASGPASARHVRVDATVGGTLKAPVLDVKATGDDVVLESEGKEPLRYPRASAHARVSLVPSPKIQGAVVHIGEEGKPDTVTAEVESVTIDGGRVEAQGVRVTGIGDPVEVDAKIHGKSIQIRAKSDGMDMHRLAKLTGVKQLELLPEGTHATFDVNLTSDARTADGHADVKIIGPKGLDAELHAEISHGKIAATAHVGMEGLGHLDMSESNIELPAGLSPDSLMRATGAVELRGAVDLTESGSLIAGAKVERMSGVASFEARIERGDPAALPNVIATAQTRGFQIVLAGATPEKSTTITGVDGLVHVAWDGRSEDGEVSALTWDAKGPLLTFDTKANVPVLDWVTGKKKIDADTLALLDVGAVLDFAQRDLAEMPAFLGSRGDLHGKIGTHVEIEGVLSHPKLLVSGHARGLRDVTVQRDQPTYAPLDGTIEGRWDGDRFVLTLLADERKRAARAGPAQHQHDEEDEDGIPASARATSPGQLRGLVLGTIKARDVLERMFGGPAPGPDGKVPDLPWSGSAEIDVANLKLAPLPLPMRFTGELTGRARIRDINHGGSVEATGSIAGFGTGGVAIEKVDYMLAARHGSLFASARARDTKGTTTLQLASRSLTWKGGFDVGWDGTAPTRLDYDVQGVRLALLQPLIRRAIPEIDGRVDGRGSASFDANSQVFEGGLSISQGRLYATVIGEEITGLTATARFERSGVFRIENATGTVGSGDFRASATGKMKGLSFEYAEGVVVIPSKDGVPLSSEGATFAEATGEVHVAAKMSDDRKMLLVSVDVPRSNLELPDRSQQTLQSLDPDPSIAIGVRREGGKLDTSAGERRRRQGQSSPPTAKAETFTTRVNLTLGDRVVVEGRGMQITLGGRAVIDIAEEIRVTGRIDLRGGSAEVYGRRFTIDRGTITFAEGGEADNPTVVAAAYWDAPDRTRVWVEFTGPLETGKLTLRSEPVYSPTEILSVLLFGRPDPNQASASGGGKGGGGDAGASAVATGAVAGDVNRLLSKIDENIGYETDTLSGNRARQKIGVSLFDRRFKAQVGYAPAATFKEPDTTFLFLIWQFMPKWSLVGTAGNKGTSILDLLFQHRY